MRIGIVSIYDNENLGNRLQNYAVQKILKEYADEVITLKNTYKKSFFEFLLKQLGFNENYWFNRYILHKNRKVKFLEFNRRYIKTSTELVSYNENGKPIRLKCDFWCVGSDQVWNPLLGRDYDFNYLGFSNREKNFSIAASFGIEQIPEKKKKVVLAGLKYIKFLSVREKRAQEIIKEVCGRNSEVLVDPTLILPAETWSKVAQKPDGIIIDGDFLVVYFLGGISKRQKEEIDKKGRELHCTLINVLDKNISANIGPSEFVWLIKNTKFVITDSFHCCVFSIIFRRQFFVFGRSIMGQSMNSRITDLLQLFGLESRLLDKETFDFSQYDDIQCNTTEDTLNSEREKYRMFLESIFLNQYD